MFDDDPVVFSDEALDDAGESFDLHVPPGHSADPFACPCCASVFSELLAHAEIDLAEHGRRMPRAERPRASPVLLVHARIMTMDEARPAAEAMLVRDGRIAWIGAEADAPGELAVGARRIDAGGRFVLPGFVEPHMHLAPLAMLHAFENLGPLRYPTIDGAIDRLAEVASETPAGEWIVGRQIDPSLQQGGDALGCDLLDEASTEHPIYVYNASLHIAYCNSMALEIAEIDASTEVPPGAELGRDARGAPNGVLKGGPAMAMVGRHNPKLRSLDLAEACLAVFAAANAVGVTTMCDQGTGLFQGPGELDLYRGLRESGRMTARFRYCLSQMLAPRWDQADVAWGQGDEWLRLTGWKIVSDGSNQGRTGLQREPFLGADDRGIEYISVPELEEAVERRLREGWAVCVHANGDAAIDRALDAFERAKRLGLDPASRRCRIEHCSILHDEQIDRLEALGVSPSFLIGHVHYWGRAFVDDIFGLEKASKLDRTGACEARGIRWTIHSDDPVTEMNPLRCIENAVTRNMWRSDELLSPEERVPVEAALRAMTLDAAWQCHSDTEVGSLEVGKLADFVVLGSDPREVAPEEIGAITVEETWVNGACVHPA